MTKSRKRECVTNHFTSIDGHVFFSSERDRPTNPRMDGHSLLTHAPHLGGKLSTKQGLSLIIGLIMDIAIKSKRNLHN